MRVTNQNRTFYVVAQDTQHGCERIDRAAAPASGVAAEEQLSPPKLRVVGKRRLGTLRRGKLRIEVTCPGSCRVKARLIAGRKVVAGRTRTRLGAGVVKLSPKPGRKWRNALRRRSRLRTTLAVDVTDDPGRATTLARVLVFRR